MFNRSDVDNKLNSDLNIKLQEEGAQVENFQVLDISFPKEYEYAISDTQNEQLKIDIALNEKNKKIEELEGLKNKIETEKEIIKTNYLVNTINDVTQIKQNKIFLKKFVEGAITYYQDKKNIYGIQELAKVEVEEALKKAFANSSQSDKYTYMLDAPVEMTSLLNRS